MSYPLAKIFTVSLRIGIFSDKWKSSYVLPIFKKGDRGSVKNYRPICQMSAIPCIFEDILYTTNLIQLSNQVTSAIESGSHVDAIYLDLAEAFDSVDHLLLLDKLRSFGFDETLINWFRSYFTGRLPTVMVNGIKSEPFEVTSGVTQGSKLGPILFAIFSNDLTQGVKYSKLELFSDDCHLSNIILNQQDSKNLRQTSIA